MNHIILDSVQVSADLIPFDIYFVFKADSHNTFSKLFTIDKEFHFINQTLQLRNCTAYIVECWAYDQHMVSKPFFGSKEIPFGNAVIDFQGVQLRVRVEERSRTPVIRKELSPMRQVTPNRRR